MPSENQTGVRWSSYLPPACALILPLVLQICWHSVNQSYPRSDEGSYIHVAQTTWLAVKNFGFWRGAPHLYLDRMWKPLLHPALVAPLLIALGGDILKTVAIAMIGYYAILLLYLFALLRLTLRPWASAFGSAIIGCVPWLVLRDHTFNADLPGAVCVLAAFYHLAKMRDFTQIRHCLVFSFWAGLGMCIRPAETVLLILLPTLVTMIRAKKASVIEWRDIFVIAASAAPFFGVLAWTSRNLAINHDLIMTETSLLPWLALIWAPAILFVAFRKRLKLSTWSLAAVIPCCLIVSGWYLPFSESLFGWVYVSSFGADAQRLARGGSDYLPFIGKILAELCGFPSLLLLTIGLLALPAKELAKNRGILLVAFGVGATLILLGASSYNPDLRYYIVPGILFLLLATTFALQPGRAYRFRLHSASLVAFFFAGLGLTSIYAPEKIPLSVAQSFPSVIEQIPVASVKQDPALEFVKKLSSVLPQDHPIRIDSIWYRPDGDLPWIIDPDLLMLIANQRGMKWDLDRLYPFRMKDVNEQLYANNQQYDYALVGPLGGDVQNDGTNPITFLARKIEDANKAGGLRKLGLKPLATLDAEGRDGKKGQFLVVQSIARVPENP